MRRDAQAIEITLPTRRMADSGIRRDADDVMRSARTAAVATRPRQVARGRRARRDGSFGTA